MATTRTPALAGANLALKFLLELGAFAAFAVWGASVAQPVAIVAPLAAIALWAVFAAPRSARRLPLRARAPFELCVFALAVAAWAVAGLDTVAVAFGVAVVVNALLMTAFRQWES